MADLTAIVLTKNEEKNLPDCLASLRGFASRVVVVDSGSTDRTVNIAREYGADVLLHPFSGYAHQFNWGLDNAAIDTEWVLRIDADERMTEAVKAECAPILALGRESGVGGITMEADFYMLGRRLRFGGAKKRKLMIFRRGWGRIEERCMDEHTLLSEGHDVRIRARFQHYDFKSVGHFASKLVWYSGREVMDVLRRAGRGRSAKRRHPPHAQAQDRPVLPPAALFPRAVHLPFPLYRSARLPRRRAGADLPLHVQLHVSLPRRRQAL